MDEIAINLCLDYGDGCAPHVAQKLANGNWEPSESSYHLIAEEASPKFASELRRLLPDYRLKNQFVDDM